MHDPNCVRAHILIKGRVQGVGFRAFLQSQAAGSGLSGWAQNLPDGRVETEVEGPQALVDAFIQLVKRGPSLASVQDVQVEWLPLNAPTIPNIHDVSFDIRS